jgi:hypothetical protein
MDREYHCIECGGLVGADGWCPECSPPVGCDDEPQVSDYDLETPYGQRMMDGEGD